MSTLITKLFRKKRIILPFVHLSQIVLSAVTSVFLIQYNTIQYNTIQYNTTSFISNREHNYPTTAIFTQYWDGWKGGGQKNNIIVVHPLSGSNLVGRCIRSPYTSLPNFISISFIVNKIWLLASFIYGAITVWPMRGFSTNISLLFESPHSNTRQYYDIGCRRHGICDHGSMSTLITKLFRKNRILTICPLVSDCTNGSNFCFPYTIWLKSRRLTHPLPVYVSAKFHIDIFHCKQDIVLGIFHIRSNNCLANERFFD